MAGRDDVVRVAREWTGTPFVHQGRVKGVGTDCIGLVIGVAWELGLTQYEFNAYSQQPDPRILLREVSEQLRPVTYADALPGDVLLFRWIREPSHFAILVDIGEQWKMVHAHRKVGRCVEHGLDDTWRRRLVGAYRLPGI